MAGRSRLPGLQAMILITRTETTTMIQTRHLLAAAMLSGLMSATALAQDAGDKPMPDERAKRLIERYGDEGIDANGDGQLTRDEVKEFFADRKPGRRGERDGADRKPGRRGERDGAERGDRRGRGRSRGGPGMGGVGVERILQRLDQLSSETPPENVRRFRRADANDDGDISTDEWKEFAEDARGRLLEQIVKRMPEADADNDGTLSDAELAELRVKVEAERRARILERHADADTDGDGKLSDAELATFEAGRRAELLKKNPDADLDGDGTLSEEEAKAFQESRRGRRGEEGRRRGNRGGRRGPGRRGGEPDDEL